MSDAISGVHQNDDVLIVGGGSAGATMAARSTEDPNRQRLGLDSRRVLWQQSVQLPASMAATVAAASGPQKCCRFTGPAAISSSMRRLRSPVERWA